ncbi:MAG: hypothetical protein QXQ57_05185 [Sulfolobales archaeon]
MRIMEKKGSPRYRIRVRFSAVVNFLVGIYRTITSFIFTVVVIRRLDPFEYGLYATLLGLANALTTPVNSWISWGSRRYVLGVMGSLRATLILGGLYLVIAIPLFMALSLIFINNIYSYFLLSILIMLFYIVLSPLGISVSLLNLYAPEKGGYLGVLFETTRVALSYYLVVSLGLSIFGAVIGPGIAIVVLIISSILLLARMGAIDPRYNILKTQIDRNFSEVIRLLKLSILSIPGIVTNALSNIDKAVIGIISSSTIPAAYASIASVPKAFISPGAFTSGLYAKILREPRGEDITDILVIYSFISIFLTSILIVLSKPAISLFNPAYVDGSSLFIMASIEALVIGYASIFEAVAMGAERADVEGRSFSHIINTALGKIPIAQMTRMTICVTAASAAQLMLWNSGARDPVVLVLPYSIAYLVSSIPYALYVYGLAARNTEFMIPWRDISVYAIASMMASYIVISRGAGDIIIRSFWRDLIALIPVIGISASVYVSISLLLSRRIRFLFIAGVKYVLKSIRL